MTNNVVPHQATSKPHEQGNYADRSYGEANRKSDAGKRTDKQEYRETDAEQYIETHYEEAHNKTVANEAEETKEEDDKDKTTGDKTEAPADSDGEETDERHIDTEPIVDELVWGSLGNDEWAHAIEDKGGFSLIETVVRISGGKGSRSWNIGSRSWGIGSSSWGKQKYSWDSGEHSWGSGEHSWDT
jgi:hypothetical protein